MPPVDASVISLRTPIAANGSGNGLLRVYFQAVYGGIRETGYNGSGYTWFGGDKPIATGKIASPIAVANTAGLKRIRVYYIDASFKLAEICYDDNSSGKS